MSERKKRSIVQAYEQAFGTPVSTDQRGKKYKKWAEDQRKKRYKKQGYTDRGESGGHGF